jgi:glutathione S-transferase
MRRARVAVGACVIALASCGGEASAPEPASEPREEQQQRPARADTGTGPRGAALDALCKEVVRETGVSVRIPPRRAGEAYPTYSRRLGRATAGIGRVYRMLHGRLKDLPGVQQDVLFQSYLSAADATARQFELASGSVVRNRIELRAALFYPRRMYRHLAARGKALGAPSCAPGPTG